MANTKLKIMKLKITLLLLLSIFFAGSTFAQVTKSIVDENKVIIQANKTFLDIEPNVLEDFESYTDFSTAFTPWILNDVDGSTTYGITDVTFPNSGTAMAYIIFNPNNTTPSLGSDEELAAHSGDKFAACFAATSPPNNDWLITPVLALGENSNVSFFGKSYTIDYGPERLKVLVSTTGTNPSDFTEISSGYIELPADWTEYTYDLAAYDNQSIHIAFQCVSNDAFILMLDDVLVSTEEVTTGSTLTGTVTNALDGLPVEGAFVEIVGLSDYTDAYGNYIIEDVPEGSLTANFMGTPTTGNSPLTVQFTDLSTSNTQLVTCSASGFITYNNNQVIIPPSTTVTLDISLSPTLSGDEMRFVVNWGANPRDLDSHLLTPEIEGTLYHIYYPSGSQGSATSAPYAALDHDVTQGFGPETMTIYDFFTGTYHYYIYKYAGDGEITTSGAVVQIYNESGLIYTLQAPTSGTGRYWYVGTIDGASQALNIINTIQETEPVTGKRNVEYPEKPDSENNQRFEINSWNWVFGDGNTSSEQNPSHIYQDAGSFDVSLTVSDGTNEKTITKDGYIITNSAVGLISVSPNEAAQGDTLTVTITGSGTHFTQGSMSIWFQQGTSKIFYNHYYTVDSVTIEVEFTFTDSHSTGLYDVFVANYQGEMMMSSAFTLNDGPGGINDLLANQVSFYPNPVRHNLIIDFGEIEDSKSVKIIDINGRIILERMRVKQNEVFDLSAYDDGMYIVCIIVDNQVLYKKIIKR